MIATIQQTIDALRRTLTEYLEATYHIARPSLVAQRRRLLEKASGIFQVPYLESTPRYVTGKRYEEMSDLPKAAREALVELSTAGNGKSVVFNPPYLHQALALHETLQRKKNLMIMTGTGSGKTESFLLPILGKLAVEAEANAVSFGARSAVRALVLYPMNALVNDQLGRLRLLFGNPRVVKMFEKWAGRPARFARYTSRTPYAGVRTPNKDSNRLSSVGDFFAAVQKAATRHVDGRPYIPEEDEKAAALLARLAAKGKWSSKQSVSGWFGQPGSQWRDRNGAYRRAILQPHDAELLTRDEVQTNPPDLLITNYSMLEYMMMRPIERPIFDKTRAWLEACPEERFLVVLDEAHLYRGAQGAEVGLLLRRLRERLGIGPERFQVICATASFSEEGRKVAAEFGAQLTGVSADTFVPITGTLAMRSPDNGGAEADVDVLSALDLGKFYSASVEDQTDAASSFLDYRRTAVAEDLGVRIYRALESYGPLNRLVNETMKAALPLAELSALCFPNPPNQLLADRALTALLALGSRARLAPEEPSLLPCRIHSFFRGLPGLWVCMDSQCSHLPPMERGGPAGTLYGQPRERCICGAPVLEYFTCRHCGTSYAKAYTNDITQPHYLWADAGERLQTGAGTIEALTGLDLLLESPSRPERGRAAHYDLRTGMLDPNVQSDRTRIVYLRPEAEIARDEEQEARANPGEFAPCGCCNKLHVFGQSSVQDHQTKGDQPFQALLSTQIRIQPPGPQAATEFAPLRGRKVLIFSDSRQMAARLAPTLQSYSLKDSIRALLPVGYRMLSLDQHIAGSLSLNQAFLAVVVAAHRFGVRLRPELDQAEAMPKLEGVSAGQVPAGATLFALMNARCPANLMRSLVDVIKDNGLGLEPLAIASVREAPQHTLRIAALPDIRGLAETSESKLAVARAWLRFWTRQAGIWFGDMPGAWWTNEVRTHRGEFKPMERLLSSREAKRIFKNEWLPRLLRAFTERLVDGGTRLLASQLSLEIGGTWQRCPTCTSVHRPIPNVTACIDCNTTGTLPFDPASDPVFLARRGFYRDPVAHALEQDEPQFISLIAAEHTAQLNAAQTDDVFSQAERHEVRFQDIDLAWRDTDPPDPAIDVLSSTTTMEVGIDIGELSGVALRNMPPSRANYQQRAGRAGRRGNAVASVVAFGSSDSHDDHYFSAPDEMIRGPVVDPRLTLENADIARRHLRAYLLQRYHEARLPHVDPEADPNLFSVLGRVRDFRRATGALNREDFRAWLNESEDDLKARAESWLPRELEATDRNSLIANMVTDVANAVDDAIGYVAPVAKAEDADTDLAMDNVLPEGEDAIEGTAGDDFDEETEFVDPSADKLLDRLLYWGVLPRYAFPTDVAPFYVFNPALSTPFRPKMEFAPSQGLNIALSQYARNKQIWIKGKQYTSKAIYSPFRNERRDAWGKRRLYFECSRCGHAKTDTYVEDQRGAVIACEACRSPASFGPAKPWFRPPGFAHPIDRPPVSTPDSPNETAYATRAKLVMPTPGPDTGWISVGKRVRVFPTRKHLLVSNSGPEGEGYSYCVACGRIEASTDPETNLRQPHSRPYPSDEPELCPGRVSGHVVLGTDFRTDIALFSLPLDAPFRLIPGNDETASALRTVCEALAKAACRLLQIESGEILAEYRPALTQAGAVGHEAEVFIYDTLAGGAGFSPQLAHRGEMLFRAALEVLQECPAGCDTSCYRCLRSFRNKIEHHLLDRKLGEQLLQHALSGGQPPYPAERVERSLDILFRDLTRQFSDTFNIERNVLRHSGINDCEIPIVMRRCAGGAETWITLSSPIAPDVPTDPAELGSSGANAPLVCVDDLLVRRNLPAAIQRVRDNLR